jgi:hypothetical protein
MGELGVVVADVLRQGQNYEIGWAVIEAVQQAQGALELFLSLALAAGPALLARNQEGSTQHAHGKEGEIHYRGGQFEHLGQDRWQRQADRLPIIHAHEDQEQQNQNQTNCSQQQFDIHK